MSPVYYNEGEIINAVTSIARGFFFPKPDIYGICDNSKSAQFMQNSESECTQTFILQSQCTTLANPLFYTKNLKVETKNA